jgi:hypothetical protein
MKTKEKNSKKKVKEIVKMGVAGKGESRSVKIDENTVVIDNVEEAVKPVAEVAPAEVKPEVPAKPLTFAEQMINGLTPKTVPGDRTLYVGDVGVKLEIIGGKVFNKGVLKENWIVRFHSGDQGTVTKVDETKAIVSFGSFDQSFSSRSEIEIIDPDKKEKDKVMAKEEAIEAKATASVKGRQEFLFNGQTISSKGVLVREIIAKYMIDNPTATIETLNEKFPAPFMGKFGLFKELSEAKTISGTGLARYLFKQEQLVKVGDKEIAICNQMTTEKTNLVIAMAKALNYEVVEKN